ncbi:MAG: alpha/beta hydrolase, partial [Myxococcota bacterium]
QTVAGWHLRAMRSSRGPRVLLLPALMHNHRVYKTLAEKLLRAHPRLVPVLANPRNFPESTVVTAPNTVPAYGRELAEVVVAERIDVIFAHSYACSVVCAALRALPRRVKLIFSSFAHTYRQEPWAARGLGAVTRTPLKRGVWPLLSRNLHRVFGGLATNTSAEEIGSMVTVARRLDPDLLWEQLGGYFDYLKQEGDLVGAIASEAERLLILQGTEDDVQFPPEVARSSHLRRSTVPDAAHLLMTDNPTAVAQEIVDFLP